MSIIDRTALGLAEPGGTVTQLPERQLSQAQMENLSIWQGNAEPPAVGDPIEHLREHALFMRTELGASMMDAARDRLKSHMRKHVDALFSGPRRRMTSIQQAGAAASQLLGED